MEFFGCHVNPQDVSVLTVQDDKVAILAPVNADQSTGQLLLCAFALDRLSVLKSDELTLGKATVRTERDHGTIRGELDCLNPRVRLVTERGLNRTQYFKSL